MIGPIREIASEAGYASAEVGYALFAYDVEVRDGTLHRDSPKYCHSIDRRA